MKWIVEGDIEEGRHTFRVDMSEVDCGDDIEERRQTLEMI